MHRASKKVCKCFSLPPLLPGHFYKKPKNFKNLFFEGLWLGVKEGSSKQTSGDLCCSTHGLVMVCVGKTQIHLFLHTGEGQMCLANCLGRGWHVDTRLSLLTMKETLNRKMGADHICRRCRRRYAEPSLVGNGLVLDEIERFE